MLTYISKNNFFKPPLATVYDKTDVYTSKKIRIYVYIYLYVFIIYI